MNTFVAKTILLQQRSYLTSMNSVDLELMKKVACVFASWSVPMTRKSYADRTDLDKLASCWGKALGFTKRKEWSAAITRAATAAEIAANIAVRRELEFERKLEKAFVDSLLKWANGLDGKISKLLLPLPANKKKKTTLKRLKTKALKINKKRNEIVHSGHFMNENEAIEVLTNSREFIDSLVSLYHSNYSVCENAKLIGSSKTKE